MAFSAKSLDVTFALGTGTFGETGANTVNLYGHRVDAQIVKAGGTSLGTLTMRVYGMTASQMQQLSALTPALMIQRQNRVTLAAGDQNGKAVVFAGQITEGWVDATEAPNISLYVHAVVGGLALVQPVPPTSYPRSADVAVIMSGLAVLGRMGFENDGVSAQLATPYFAGSLVQQIRACADAAHIDWLIDGAGSNAADYLTIFPRGQGRTGTIPLVSPATGLIGYPSFTGLGIAASTQFNPTIRPGGRVQVQSSLTPACGTWFVVALSHSLQSELPGGEWMTSFQGAPLTNAYVVP